MVGSINSQRPSNQEASRQHAISPGYAELAVSFLAVIVPITSTHYA